MLSKAFVVQPKALAEVVMEKLRSSPYTRKGWIMYDYPSTPEEARAAQRAGVLPTATLRLLGTTSWSEDCTQTDRTQELARIYQATLSEVNVVETERVELAGVLVRAAQKKRPTGVACVFRVLLMGPSGCRRHTQARGLADAFDLVHVNFQYLYRQASLRDDDIGKKIKSCKMTYSDMVELLHRRLCQKDCLQQGWVLTHFPRTVREFEILDRMDTPPNRVIILTICEMECKKRIIEHDLKGLFQYSEFGTKSKLKDVEDFFRNECLIRSYCGETATSVDATGTAEYVQTAIQEAVMNPPDVDLIRGADFFSEDCNELTSYDHLLRMDSEYALLPEG